MEPLNLRPDEIIKISMAGLVIDSSLSLRQYILKKIECHTCNGVFQSEQEVAMSITEEEIEMIALEYAKWSSYNNYGPLNMPQAYIKKREELREERQNIIREDNEMQLK